jgi:glutamyl-tRNA reductase
MRARRGKPVLLIDIAVPRDVEPRVQDLDDVYLYNIDDLQAVVDDNLAGRQVEATRVEELVEEEVVKFQAWMRGLEVTPTIRQLKMLAEGIVDSEFARVGGRLSHLSQRDRDVVETLLRGVVNKLQHPVIMHLKDAASTGNGYHEVEQVRAMFGLGRETENAATLNELGPTAEGTAIPAVCETPEPAARGTR